MFLLLTISQLFLLSLKPSKKITAGDDESVCAAVGWLGGNCLTQAISENKQGDKGGKYFHFHSGLVQIE